MKSFVAPVVLSMMAVGASAYTSEPPTSTTPTPNPTGCPATYDPACPFFCGSRGQGSFCRTDSFITGPGNPGCNVCPGVPGECPAVPDTSCAYLCTKTGEIFLGPGSPDRFCSPNNATLGPLTGSGPNSITCVLCESDDGEPEPTTTATTPPSSGATGCPAAYDPTCHFFCGSRGGGSYCTSDSFSTGPGTPGCTVCSGIPSECPAVPDKSCAYVCTKTGEIFLGPGSPDRFCAPNNATLGPLSADLSGPNAITCVPCESDDGEPEPEPTTSTPVPTSKPTGCPATFDPECPYFCSSVRAPAPGTFCSTSFSAGPGGRDCVVCPGHPSSCPAVPDESCAFLCEGSEKLSVGPGIGQFCYPNNITLLPAIDGEPNWINCVACGGGNPTYPPPTNTTSVPPPPEYTGAASRFSISGVAALGLAAIAIFML